MMQNQEEKGDLATQNPVYRLSPVSDYPSNKYGLRPMGYGSSEWSLLSITSGPEKLPPPVNYVLMPEGVPRKPWEAFSRTGFRTARNVQ